MTVSRVINTPHLVAEKTRRHVESAMSDLGYIKNNIASCLASSKDIFCFVIMDSTLDYIDVPSYIKTITKQGMIPCFLCFKNKEDLAVSITKAKSFGSNEMYIVFNPVSEFKVSRILADEKIINLELK